MLIGTLGGLIIDFYNNSDHPLFSISIKRRGLFRRRLVFSVVPKNEKQAIALNLIESYNVPFFRDLEAKDFNTLEQATEYAQRQNRIAHEVYELEKLIRNQSYSSIIEKLKK